MRISAFINLQSKIKGLFPEAKSEHILAFQKTQEKLKLLLVRFDKGKIFLQSYREYELNGENTEKTAEFLGEFISDNKVEASKTVCFLPLSSLYVRKLTFPYRKVSQIKKSISFAVEPHIPISIENAKVFFRPIYPVEDKSESIFLLKKIAGLRRNNGLEVISFVIHEDILNEQLELVSSAKLRCDEIYLTPLAILNFFISNISINENILWVNAEKESACIYHVLSNGELADLREVPIDRENIDREQEQIKREISTMLLSQSSKSLEGEIEKIYISGVHVEIVNWLAGEFGLPVELVDFNEMLSLEKSAEFSISGGVSTISGLVPAVCGRVGPFAINFHPPVLQEKERKGIIAACSIAIFALFVLTFRIQFEKIIYERRYNVLNSQIKEIFMQTFPEAEDVRTPILQMKSRIKSLKGGAASSDSLSKGSISPLEILRELSQMIDKSQDIQVDSFGLKENSATIYGSALSYQDIDKVKEALEASSLFKSVDIESAQTTDKGVDFRLKISTE